MRKRGRGPRLASLVVLALTLALVTACSLAPLATSQSNANQVSSTVTKDFTVGAAPELVVSDQVGAISVQTGDAGKVSVEATKRARSQDALDRIEVSMIQDGNVVRLEYRIPQGMGSVTSGDPSVEFKVKVPATTKATLTAETGSIDVRGLTTGVGASATTGAVTTADVKGLQALTAKTGAISVARADGTVQATTTTGMVTVDGSLVGENWARATTGAVTVKLPTGANLKVSAKGTSAQSDLGLTGQGGQLGGTLGAGTGGSLDASSGTGLVQVMKR